MRAMLGWIGAIWGLIGVASLLGSAVMRLTPLAIDAFHETLLWYHWVTLAAVLVFMAYAEGYRAFQQRFSPRVAARARYLASHPRWLDALFAPLFCMAYFRAPRRRRIASISVTAGVVVLIVLVRMLPQPWRGIVDAGVVVGLTWGLVSLAWFVLRAFGSRGIDVSPEVPDPA